MSHLPTLVSDLALILITAGLVTIVFKLFKQPVVLGYIVAGFLVSPNFALFPNVGDMTNISTWAEIGVIFLLFALGLEFSFKKLIDVGGTASISSFIDMGSMIAMGYIIGQLMGWSDMESIFLGGMLSMSSTTIIIKAFNDMGLQKKKFAGIVFGMLIVEDLVAILLLVLLSTIAVSQHFEGMDLIFNVLKLIFFVVIWFVGGIYIVPSLLKRFNKYLNDETLLIIAMGMCLGMVLFASAVGFSAALGAFIMGSILAETVESKHIEHLLTPIKNLFGAVFFVSVGMMISPNILVEYALPIFVITLAVIIGHVLFATIGVMASGEGLRVAMQAGFSLAVIGEFSFIIATLGMKLGVISDFIYPIIVSVSVITTFTTPYMIKAAIPLYNILEQRIPEKWEKFLIGYAASNQKTLNLQNDWNILLRKVLSTVSIYFLLALAAFFLSRNFVIPFVLKNISGIGGSLTAALITLLLMTPFMGAIVRRETHNKEAERLWKDSHFNKGALIALSLLRATLCVMLILMVLIPLFPKATAVLLIIALGITILFAFNEGFKNPSKKMENRFFENLNIKENTEDRKKTLNKASRNLLLAKNIHLEEIEVPQNSPRAGKTLAELNFKQTTGVNIVSIIRGSIKINIPDGNVQLFPFDKLIVSGTDEELQQLMNVLEWHKQSEYETEEAQHQVSLSQYEIEADSPLIGKPVRDSRIKEKTECMIIGLERNGHEVVKLTSDTILELDDTLWIAGEKMKLDKFQENLFDNTDLSLA
ncbi:MAG: hypothetical protein RL662_873 [Bacteroidota bacterium]|jgi:CPA2 family monovalent cation:H+ antiporter-2